ncbi:hypothetical protein OG897_08600 [Streptomyces sp. NBC_00237]|uniref:hypothetical protein n=1 Tax=Streptomyces sp. NBC_00237 TaxID=2975687 RepID=UPI0022504E43|nr:hypothetical protein [Streptomyces sp. NBC_00237]MCX5201509.1 hypothetical protein [Streptomyces sp. NBC_00237]
MTALDWAAMAQLADKVAKSIAASWPIVEKDDVKQEILTACYEGRQALEPHADNGGLLWGFCKTAGVRYASRERDARDVEDERYYYTPSEARIALGSFIYSDEEMGQLLGRKDDLLGCRVTDNLMSARMDASKALERLPEEQRARIMSRYVMGIPCGSDTERKAANRAVDMLARQMNRDLRS